MKKNNTEKRRKGPSERRIRPIARRQFIDIGWAIENERRKGPEERRKGPKDRREK